MSVIRLQNDSLSVSVFPKIGAKIYDLIERRSGYNFLWHNPRIAPQPYPIEANFDNYWCGGWDDGFPTCEACTHCGEQYPNLGELRSVRWTLEGQDDSSLALSAFGPISPIKAHKQLRLRETSRRNRIHYCASRLPPASIIFGARIQPMRSSRVASSTFPLAWGLLGRQTIQYWVSPANAIPGRSFRLSSASRDMSVMHPAGRYSTGHYATDLSAGWYAVEYPHRGIGVLFEFPLDLCPYLWLWLSYGGWRGYYLAVVEPWTSHPVTLSEAVAAGTHRVLTPGERICFKTRVTPWSSPVTLDSVLRKNGLIES